VAVTRTDAPEGHDMPLHAPFPELDELLAAMGEAGSRICDIDASEAGAGTICPGCEAGPVAGPGGHAR
jgi:hypothetical protein